MEHRLVAEPGYELDRNHRDGFRLERLEGEGAGAYWRPVSPHLVDPSSLVVALASVARARSGP